MWRASLKARNPKKEKKKLSNSAPGKWGRTQKGSDGFNRALTGF